MKLDLGCGSRPRAGFIGVDIGQFDGKVDVVCDLRQTWPWQDKSVDEVWCSHFVEHLTAQERAHFANELYRVLRPGCTATIITPHWAAGRAYGDPTHVWPPVSEFWYHYLNRAWRQSQAPHTCGMFTCNFGATWSYTWHPEFENRSVAEQEYAAEFYKEAVRDLVAVLVPK